MFRPEYKVHPGVSWWLISQNENAWGVLDSNMGEIDWNGLMLNKTKNARDLLKQNLDRLNEFDWQQFSRVYEDESVLEQNIDKIYWYTLLQNPNAVNLIKKNLHQIPNIELHAVCYNSNLKQLQNEYEIYQLIHTGTRPDNNGLHQFVTEWSMLSMNEHVIDLLENNIDKINWCMLSSNKNAISILERNVDKINWHWLSRNPNAVPLLEKHVDKIIWSQLSGNPNAIHLLERNVDKIDWEQLSQNRNPRAIPLLEKHLAKVSWKYISSNPNAVHLLERNVDKINWNFISANPNAVHLFAPLDTEKMRETCRPFSEELAAYVFHPTRVCKLASTYEMELCDYFESI